MNENLCEKSVFKLGNEKKVCFVVPSYQRGYRWDGGQINKLLDDFYEFGDEKYNKINELVGKYYCLQPIVVKKMKKDEVENKLGDKCKDEYEYYEIVDGQQRMTTIYILCKYLLIDTELPYLIRFERDKELKEKNRFKLLEEMNPKFDFENVEKEYNFIDAYYFKEAFSKIKERLDDKDEKKEIVYKVLSNDVHVIWYEIDIEEDCYKIFKDINSGKIPLTDAELVKAMLLNSKNYMNKENSNKEFVKHEQDRYARLWDEIQKALRDDGMWAFITGGGNINIRTRIDFLIQLLVENENYNDTDYQYFYYFENQLAKNGRGYCKDIFEKLKDTFRIIQDWYNNYELYNYVGFILTYHTDDKKDVSKRIKKIKNLISMYNDKEISDAFKFKEMLIKIIKDELLMKNLKENFDIINYIDNRKDVEKLLMLFNIEELNDLHMKFDFRIDEQGWSIEHIKAQHSENIRKEDRIEFLKNETESLEKLNNNKDNKIIENIIKEINNLLKNESEIKDDDFKKIVDQIDKSIDGFDEEHMHMLGNLALLSKRDNSSLNNKSFYQKRSKINEWLKDPNKNIPYSTRKAFLKMYSEQDYGLDFIRWKKEDFDCMFKIQKNKLSKFF